MSKLRNEKDIKSDLLQSVVVECGLKRSKKGADLKGSKPCPMPKAATKSEYELKTMKNLCALSLELHKISHVVK